MQIDGVNILVAHVYAKMKKKDAVEDMLKQGFVPGETEAAKKAWAEKAYDLINPKKGPAEVAGPSLKDQDAAVPRFTGDTWTGLGSYKTEQNK